MCVCISSFHIYPIHVDGMLGFSPHCCLVCLLLSFSTNYKLIMLILHRLTGILFPFIYCVMSDYEFSSSEEEDDYRAMEEPDADEGHDLDEESSSDDDVLPADASPIYQRTQSLGRALSGQNICQKVLKVLDTMSQEGLDLPLFLDALSWGDAECITNGKVRYARTALLGSVQLPRILKRWHNPPRDKQNKGQRAAGAHQALESFATECVSKKIKEEMDFAADVFKFSGDHIVEEQLMSIHLRELQQKVSDRMPIFWSILEAATTNKGPKNKRDEKMVCTCVCVGKVMRLPDY